MIVPYDMVALAKTRGMRYISLLLCMDREHVLVTRELGYGLLGWAKIKIIITVWASASGLFTSSEYEDHLQIKHDQDANLGRYQLYALYEQRHPRG